jgi:Zn-dependent peptidase ImmA (M78 family)
VDDAQVQSIARSFVARIDISNIQKDLTAYVEAANARLDFEEMGDGQSGCSFIVKGKQVITINSRETEERQRFTICHEVAHLVLELPSSHDTVPSWSYAKRDLNEVLCDKFAAELLMPYKLFLAKIPDGEPSLEVLQYLANEFCTSFPATASRYAELASFPCAFVTMERGRIRYAARSTTLRARGAWIAPRSPIPPSSIANRLREAGTDQTATGEVAQDVWFSDWDKSADLYEMSRHYSRFDQTLALLWTTEEELPEGPTWQRREGEEDEGLNELSGELPWPGKQRRR